MRCARNNFITADDEPSPVLVDSVLGANRFWTDDNRQTNRRRIVSLALSAARVRLGVRPDFTEILCSCCDNGLLLNYRGTA